uniref:Retrovirus-related Pol polyprotein from transposon TNT 1-94 n=1 Tax=Tanacetum cinerariifolium TaxID=118510 RepID=A0A699IAL5_TANCI|nr:hypothetical protein [Tanacetum cinerariifolium]
MQNTKDTSDPTTSMNMALDHIAKALMINKTIPTTNNQRSSSNPSITQIAQTGQFAGYQSGKNAVQNARKKNRISVDTRLKIRIQLQAKEFDLMAAVAHLDEIEEVNANCILMANLQQASTSDTQTNKAPVYDSNGSAEAANYQDFGLEELIPTLWIESDKEYNITTAHGISHWWFKRKEFYISRHSAPSDRSAVSSYMWILSVVSLKTISRFGYTFLKEIILRRADYKEYKILEFDFKNLQPNDIEDLDRNDEKKMMRETEVHKFSDGTLTRILEKLDHMVKDFKLFKYNPGMETRI